MFFEFKIKYCKIFLFYFSIAFFAKNSFAISLDEYLNEVQGKNLNYSTQIQKDESFKLLKRKAELVTAPNFFAGAETGHADQTIALTPIRYQSFLTQNYYAGISQNFSFGLGAKFTYNLSRNAYTGLTIPVSNPLSSRNYQSRPIIELNFPLLQNRFGSLTKATEEQILSQNQSQRMMAKANSISFLVSAEQAYFALVAAKKNVSIQENAKLQAKKILDYVTRKEKMNLGDQSDILQADALFKTKELELQQAKNDLILAIRNFNYIRGKNSEEFNDSLDEIDFTKIKQEKLPNIKDGTRFDILAEKENMRSAIAGAKIEEENNKPNLNLYGSYALKGVQSSPAEVAGQSFNSTLRKDAFIGMKFTVPLYFGTIMDIQKGAKINASAAKSHYQQRLLDEENDWKNLIVNLNFYQEKVILAQKIELAQRLKLENERILLKQGRTSTYQVLLFEQEYSSSQLNLINSASNFLILMAQLKLYQ